MKMLKRVAAVWLLGLMAACGGGGGSSGDSPLVPDGGGTATPVPTITMSISSTNVSVAAPVDVAAKLLDGTGKPIVGEVISFSTSGGLGEFSALTALTDAAGTATVKLSPKAATAAGSDKVVASATVGTATAVTSSIGFTSAGNLAPVTSKALTIDMLTSSNQFGSGGDSVTITAIVKGTGNVSLADEPVVFSADSGALTEVESQTDSGGSATAKLSAGASKSNRTIVVTATAGTISSSVSVSVVGTSLSFSGVTTIGLGTTERLSIKATDAKSVPISNLSIAVSSSLGNGLSASRLITDSQGNASVDYTATRSGRDTLTFAGGGVTLTPVLTISGEDFSFVSPASNTQIVVGVAQSLTVRYLSGGLPQAGRAVTFAATAGVVTPATTVLTDAGGLATASVTSTTASPATIQATLGNNIAQATLPVEFVAITPASLVLQVSPTAIGPNPNGTSSQQAQLIATVRDANGNPVKGRVVNFNRVADPSGGNLSQASATTDSSGQASVQYVAGGLTTASNGVHLRAAVATAPSVAGDAFMSVSQSALFIALGTSNEIENLTGDNSTYKKDWTVSVTDANGAVVPNVNLTIRVLPTAYYKGELVFVEGSGWIRTSTSIRCLNEDVNYNGVLDTSPAEDTNGNGTLQPGNVISVTPGSVTTDSNGRAIVSLLYGESYVPWVDVKLQAQAVVSGTESINTATFTVPGSAADFNNEDVEPAGVVSPFGTATSCTNPN